MSSVLTCDGMDVTSPVRTRVLEILQVLQHKATVRRGNACALSRASTAEVSTTCTGEAVFASFVYLSASTFPSSADSGLTHVGFCDAGAT